ncbi:MAG: alpha/beta hydrolase [Betaproteobacteria bacterium]|nr:alpha/beta hydrolase [Betaproteobacteria bacterium]
MRRAWLALLSALLITRMCEADANLLSWKDILQRPALKADHRVPYGPQPQHFGDLWLPSGAGPHPVVILVHGGCWLAEYPGVELTHFLADGLRRAGYAVWEIEYRRLGHPGAEYPGMFLDVADATDQLRKLAVPHALDLSRVVATGHSAGGHLALWLAARAQLPQGSPLTRAHPLPVHAVVGIAAITDIEVFATAGAHACGADTVSRLVDVPKRGKAAYADTSPMTLIIPVRQWLVQGRADRLVLPHLGHAYAEAKRKRGESIDVVDLPDAGHFELIAPWTAAWPPIADTFRKAFSALAR